MAIGLGIQKRKNKKKKQWWRRTKNETKEDLALTHITLKRMQNKVFKSPTQFKFFKNLFFIREINTSLSQLMLQVNYNTGHLYVSV